LAHCWKIKQKDLNFRCCMLYYAGRLWPCLV